MRYLPALFLRRFAVGVILLAAPLLLGQAAPPAPAVPAVPAKTPPVCAGEPLVDAATLIPDAVVEMKYATADNMFKRPMYAEATCWLRKSVAERLARAAAILREQGYRLVLWDCYRPPAVQREMFRLHPAPGEVAHPKVGSNHSRGSAVDVSLADREGKPLAMPTGFDAFVPAAWREAADLPPEAKANRERLKAAMRQAGFSGIRREWWHYNAKGAEKWGLCGQ
ncbi:MAG: D-alanyl-D-alanine dipeptidase [Myxococcales bacterium]|nr:MAG: D-alanyl-D-alanine dipeptidase [Myxococcales bacterium]